MTAIVKGQPFGSLRVKRIDPGKHRDSLRYWCKCKCGNEKYIKGSDLLRGHYKSCGCEKLRGRLKNGFTLNGKKHKLYGVYSSMTRRCYERSHSDYHNYGGRGIRVCSAWLGKDGCNNFIQWGIRNGWAAGKYLDRIRVNGNYSPGNCRFVTPKQSTDNRRSSIFVKYRNKRMTFLDAWRISPQAVHYNSARHRYLKMGWTIAKALESPPLHTRIKK